MCYSTISNCYCYQCYNLYSTSLISVDHHIRYHSQIQKFLSHLRYMHLSPYSTLIYSMIKTLTVSQLGLISLAFVKLLFSSLEESK